MKSRAVAIYHHIIFYLATLCIYLISVIFPSARGRLCIKAGRATKIAEGFLLSLGVSAETARLDAEGIEHRVSPWTLKAFRRAMNKVR
jgi:hypothetical protein